MKQKHTNEEMQSIYQRYKNGEPVTSITKSTGIPHSTIYSWIQSCSKIDSQKTEISSKNLRLLQNKIARLEGIIEIIHKAHCFASDPLQVKLAALESLYGRYNSICSAMLCRFQEALLQPHLAK